MDTEDVGIEREDERKDRNREIVTVHPGSLCHGVTY